MNMINNFDELKRNYAKLIVNRGLNLPKGRYIKIITEIDEPDFINTLVKECYLVGAKRVTVKWQYTQISRIFYSKTPLAELKKIDQFEQKEIEFNIKNNVSIIYLESTDPNYLKGIDPNKITTYSEVRRAYINKLRGEAMYCAPFTIACVPSKAWAKTLFPKMKTFDAVNHFWALIFKVCHVNVNNPYKAWDEHCTKIDQRAKWLNSLKIKTLHYENKLGTNLKVGMTNHYCFAATADYDIKEKTKYYSNIPTEECFVSPHRLLTEGVVVSSKPLCVSGQLIEGIKLKFKKGRIVEIHAKKNEALLKKLINAEENTHYLGEAALVPFSSPINQTGVIFLHTLLDENACSHFAFGDSYRYTYKGYDKMKKDDLIKAGLNYANNHVDFMIGTKDLKVTATTLDNKKIIIFKNGEWAKI